MKRRSFSPVSIPRLEDTAFWSRCSLRKKALWLLSLLLLLGVLAGSLLAVWLNLDRGNSLLPLFFSGIPTPEAGFLSCFSTLLLNLLIFLTLSFLLGVTAFGDLAIPLLAAAKGITVGLGASSFLWVDGLKGLGRSALIYTPAAAASLLLFLLFGVRALVFSDRLRKAGFSPAGESLDFRDYWKDYLRFLCLSVIVSLLGAALAALGSVFLP